MRDLTVRRAQRMLTFDQRDLWQRLPDPDRRRCRELMGHLPRVVLQAEATTRNDHGRENPDRPS
jgi:hypothetical protein